MVLSIVLAVLVFSLLVVSHEFGHFIGAEKDWMRVPGFSGGLGPGVHTGG